LGPREFGTLYEQLPVKKHNGILVSEWEGVYIDKAGFVKFDILGVNQFDKFNHINRLIKQDTGRDIRYKDIGLTDEKVFELFRKGYNEDVFQLGGTGLKGYCKLLQPENIEDLIATVALYRPGPIESNAHLKYVKRKNGEEEVVADPGCSEITKTTYGLIIYQEQTMKICQEVGGFSLVEADDIRKALGKMKFEIIQPYKTTFLERSTKKGYREEDMLVLWDKMEAFAAYAFNRSHSAAYAITGYYSQWFKANYPLQFWTVSLEHSSPDDLQNKISEIKNSGSIDIVSVDINYSGYVFRSEVATKKIYWALPSVKWVGDKAVQTILEEREKRGKFFSLEEFYERVKDNKPDKRAMYNLIISGAFDEIENISYIEQRYTIMEKFSQLIKEKDFKDEYKLMKEWREYQWTLKEKELTGFGFFNFKLLIEESDLFLKQSLYKDNQEILIEDLSQGYKNVLVIGLVEDVIRRNSKKGDFVQVQIRDNTEILYITIWNETFEKYKEELLNCTNKILIFFGALEYDTYKNRNVVRSIGDSSKLEIL
jgi:DNA polymerase-3 subunit alpha